MERNNGKHVHLCEKKQKRFNKLIEIHLIKEGDIQLNKYAQRKDAKLMYIDHK